MTQTLDPQVDPLTSARSEPEPGKRPRAVTIVGVIAILIAILNLILAVTSMLVFVGILIETQGSPRALSDQEVEVLVLGIVLLILALATLVTAVALLRMQRWAWSVLMTLAALGLTSGLVGHFSGRDTYGNMLLYTALAFALNRAVIQEAFGIRRASR
jgi:hypothetical protein